MAKQKQTQGIAFEEVVERGCGLDVHKKEMVATVSGTGIESETRTFQSTTSSLTALKEWLLALGVTHVAMESTEAGNEHTRTWRLLHNGGERPSHQICPETQSA